jgi:hypothetical protein
MYQIIQSLFIDFRNFEVTDYSVRSVRLTFVSVGQSAGIFDRKWRNRKVNNMAEQLMPFTAETVS